MQHYNDRQLQLQDCFSPSHFESGTTVVTKPVVRMQTSHPGNAGS